MSRSMIALLMHESLKHETRSISLSSLLFPHDNFASIDF